MPARTTTTFLIAAAGLIAVVLVAQALRPATEEAPATSGAAAVRNGEASRSREVAGSPADRVAESLDHPEESEISKRWDDLSSADRLEHLTREFERAMAALENGDGTLDDRHDAEAALTALRFELYDSDRGRQIHRTYELRLERALGEAVDEGRR